MHYIKEESRENYYLLIEEKSGIIVYNDKQYSLFPYIKELLDANITNFQIDANFLTESKIKEYISFYSNAIHHITNKNFLEYNKLKETFCSEEIFDTPFINEGSFLLKEGNK